jgi:TolA-binding protein
MKPDDCTGALVLRSMKETLSATDELLLDAHLGSCESCRLLRQVLLDFNEAADADRHDGARIERLAAFARNGALGRRLDDEPSRFPVSPTTRTGLPRAKGLRGVLLAAAVFLLVAGASAAIIADAVGSPVAVAEHPVLGTEPTRHVAVRSRRVAEDVAAAVGMEFGRVSDALAPPLAPLAPAVDASSECQAGGCFDAASVFREANEARQEGRTSAAIAGYRELQRRAPASPEAQFSHLSLGNLLLAQGEGTAALSQFDAALRARAARNVQAEALYGRGLALARLGRTKEERATWLGLVERFESSPYAAHARRRLGRTE